MRVPLRRFGWLGLISIAACSGEHVEVGTGLPEASTASEASDAGPSPSPNGGGLAPSQGAAFETGVDGAVEPLGELCADAGTEATDSGGPSPDASANLCGCTRRPAGAPNPFRCPRGLGEYVSTVIGPSGGSVEIQGRQYAATGISARIDVPPTAIATPTTIVLTETAIPPPHDFVDWSPVYRVEPVGLALSSPTMIRFPSSNLGSVPSDLALWFSADGTCFTQVPDSFLNTDVAMGFTQTLGYYLVGVARSASTLACP